MTEQATFEKLKTIVSNQLGIDKSKVVAIDRKQNYP